MTDKFNFPSIRQSDPNLILGLGLTGIAAAKWCLANDVKVKLLDTRVDIEVDEFLNSSAGILNTEFGPESLSNYANLDGIDSIILSPGLNPNEPALAKFLKVAKEKNIETIGEIELFARALNDLAAQKYKPLVFAVTGTNGKTTVTSLLGQLLHACGLTVRVAGNIGPAALTSLLDAVHQESLPDAWVLELSSFQLYTTSSLRVDAAVVLNISQDHLDWHGSMENYIAAKAKLFDMSTVAVVNRNDPSVLAMVPGLESSNVRSFGFDKPTLNGDFGVQLQNEVTWLTWCQKQSEVEDKNNREAALAQNIMPAAALQLVGKHNVLNALAALCMASSAGLPLGPMLHELRLYRGEPHRTEFVRSIHGIDFINDSKGTNVGATIAALEGIEKPIILIAGGLGKGQDFSLLAQAVKNHAKAVCLIGQDANLIAQSLSSSGVPIELSNSLEHAVEQSFDLAQAGDVVLLSPACASMDMFKNYVDRGRRFIAAVRELALDQGELA